MNDVLVPARVPQITLLRVCRVCRSEPEFVIELVKARVVEPMGARPCEWRFTPWEQQRMEMAAYLWRRFDLNPEGIAFVMRLLDMNRMLREQLLRVR